MHSTYLSVIIRLSLRYYFYLFLAVNHLYTFSVFVNFSAQFMFSGVFPGPFDLSFCQTTFLL